jgi:hypothetical protein
MLAKAVVNLFNFLKVFNMKLGILAYHNKVQLLENGHNFESYIFGVMPLFNLVFCQNWLLIVVALNRWVLKHRMQCSCL